MKLKSIENWYKEHTKFLESKKLWVVLLADLVGTAILVFIIIAPSSLASDGSIAQKMWETKVWAAFWIASWIWLLVVFLERFSASMNPAVSIVGIYKGNSARTGILKVLFEFIGAFIAAIIVWALAEHVVHTFDENSMLGANGPNYIPSASAVSNREIINMEQAGHSSWWWIIVLLLEFIGTWALLHAVFSKRSAKFEKQDDLFKRASYIWIILFITIFIVDTASAAGLNPARTFAPAVVAEIAGGYDGIIAHSSIHLLAQMTAIMCFGTVQLHKDKKTIIWK